MSIRWTGIGYWKGYIHNGSTKARKLARFQIIIDVSMFLHKDQSAKVLQGSSPVGHYFWMTKYTDDVLYCLSRRAIV